MLSLVIGGARSGKSRFALSLSTPHQRPAFIATARADDEEMAARIARHRAERASGWTTIEEPLDLAGAVERSAATHDFLLLDCLTIWLGNWMWAQRGLPEADFHSSASLHVRRAVAASAGTHLVVVSNELGCGLVPESPVGRRFRDVHGWLNQEVARAADRVYHVVAGISVLIKQPEARP